MSPPATWRNKRSFIRPTVEIIVGSVVTFCFRMEMDARAGGILPEVDVSVTVIVESIMANRSFEIVPWIDTCGVRGVIREGVCVVVQIVIAFRTF